jgi:excisionase family DNA binding protein
MGAEKLLTPEAAAKILLIKPDTLRGWLRTGKFKGVKVHRLWRIRESDLEAFLERGKTNVNN